MKRPQPALSERTLPLAEFHEETAPLEEARGPVALLLDRYRLERRLGAGGFGVVWRAFDERLQREVAVKVVPREGGERADREARAAARLSHPGIVALYELVADSREAYLVFELVHGRTLGELIRARALSDRDVARVGAALCDALEHAHGRGVVHRDVKPQNVMVVDDPAAGAGFAKLTDFGVAHLAGGDALTRTGDVVGTLAYMSPEQANGERATPASDVYALALTLYEAFAGVNPVRARGPAATARRLGRRLPSLGTRRRDLPEQVCDSIDDAVEPRPEHRPPLAELREALREAEPLLSDEGGLHERRSRQLLALDSRRPLALLWRGAAGAAAAGLVAAAFTRLGPSPPASPLSAALVTLVVVALLPRAGWACAATAVCSWLAAAGRPGTALVLAAALSATPLLLPRAGLVWSIPAFAPLLGAVALGPAFVGLAALASSAWRRAGLAAAGFLWLATAELLSGTPLLFGVPDGAAPRIEWDSSVTGAATHALGPMLSSPALAPLLVWAAFAALLPLAVRGRFLALDVVGAGMWAAALVAAQAGLGDLLAATTTLGEPRGAVTGATLGAAAAVAAATLRAPPEPPPIPSEQLL